MSPRAAPYDTPAAFAQALEAHLRRRATGEGGDLVRWRRLVAFDRLLTRLFVAGDASPWMVKGGYGLEVRYGVRARTTKDVDLALPSAGLLRSTSSADAMALQQRLVLDVRQPVADFFSFRVGEPNRALRGVPGGGLGIPIHAVLAGRVFMSFAMDVVVGEPVQGEPEWCLGLDLLAFAGITPTRLRVVSLEQHFAEKIHAYVRPRAWGFSTRVKDLADLVLMLERGLPSDQRIRAAVQGIFVAHSEDPPPTLRHPPADWADAYSRLAAEMDVAAESLDEAFVRLSMLWRRLGFSGPPGGG